MSHVCDIIIIGAGPAGLAAAVESCRRGLRVALVDENSGPGGQIWRNVETADQALLNILGKGYADGLKPIAEFRSAPVLYFPNLRVWQIEPGFRVFGHRGPDAMKFEAPIVIYAGGAQERPMPFPGWTLPGVLTVGAAQIALKSAKMVPRGASCVIAGAGPLPLLFLEQMRRAGVLVKAFLDTSSWTLVEAIKFPLSRAALGDLAKGAEWVAKLKVSGTRVVQNVQTIEALGGNSIERVRFVDSRGRAGELETSLLLSHEGLVPNLHPLASLGCETVHDEFQHSFRAVTSDWLETSRSGVFVAGDAARIGGARIASLTGRLAAMGAARKLGKDICPQERKSVDMQLAAEGSFRRYLDRLYPPRRQILNPTDDTVVCRCEHVCASEVRELATTSFGPNQLKAYTRAGMGPCQGRQCGYTINGLLADAQLRDRQSVGLSSVRPPLRPISLGELAAVSDDS